MFSFFRKNKKSLAATVTINGNGNLLINFHDLHGSYLINNIIHLEDKTNCLEYGNEEKEIKMSAVDAEMDRLRLLKEVQYKQIASRIKSVGKQKEQKEQIIENAKNTLRDTIAGRKEDIAELGRLRKELTGIVSNSDHYDYGSKFFIRDLPQEYKQKVVENSALMNMPTPKI